MKLPIEESEFITSDLRDIVRWIHADNPDAAVRFVEAFKATVEQLAVMPGMGWPRPDLGEPGTRSWRVRGFRRFLIFYEANRVRLRLLRVLHGARDLQSALGGDSS